MKNFYTARKYDSYNKLFRWYAISNGVTAYWTNLGRRPPEISIDKYGFELINKEELKNRPIKDDHLGFTKFCREKGYEVFTPKEHIKKSGLSSFFQNKDDTIENIERFFNQVTENYNKWLKFDQEYKKEFEQGEETRRKVWLEYYRLKNPSGIDVLTGQEFEIALSSYYEKLGYTVKLTSNSGDYGVDILASKNGVKLAIQAKRYSGKVGVKAIQEVASGAFFYKADKALVITNSEFTKPAINMAKRTDVELISGLKLRKLLNEVAGGNVPTYSLGRYRSNYDDIEIILKKAGRW